MTYYEPLVNDPEAVIDNLAKTYGYTREVMLLRLQEIQTAALNGGHITLSESRKFHDKKEQLSAYAIAHVEDCIYCKTLLDKIQPAFLKQSQQGIAKQILATLDAMDANNQAKPAERTQTSNIGKQMGAAVAATLTTGVIGGFIYDDSNQYPTEAHSTDLQVTAESALDEYDPNTKPIS